MKKVEKTAARKRIEKLEKDAILIRAAIKQGYRTKLKISKATGLKVGRITTVFKNNEELYGEYKLFFSEIKDLAVDNLEDIVKDKKHKRNFEATKFVLQTYKSDLDESLEKQSSDGEVEVEVGGASHASPIVIKFKKTTKED